MGFFAGRVTCTRFRVLGHSPGMFGPQHLAKLEKNAIGKARVPSGDGVEIGWTAGDHVLDVDFDLAKNVINETLHFGLRVDQTKFPPDLLRAYTQVEVKALAANNPSGQPSNRQKKQAKQSALDRLEEEARDGRFLKRKVYPLLWDSPSNELLAGTASATAIDRLLALFQQTFGQSFEALTAGRQAFLLSQVRQQTRGVDDANPSPFVSPKLWSAP